ncbi:MAG: LTA synthase family protein [Candidatus Saccharibacteria bacterium]|nr:LTA synthase family protein [Candidatus Saccharibacteria bacterium]
MYTLAVILTFLNSFAFFGLIYLKTHVGMVSVDEIIYHLKVPLAGTANVMVLSLIGFLVVLPLLTTLIAAFILKRLHVDFRLKTKKKDIHYASDKIATRVFVVFALVALVAQLIFADHKLGVTDYIANQLEDSPFIEDHYVDPEKTEIEFPEKKRNLIHIYLESMEGTFFDKTNNGYQKESLIPELQQLAQENTNFSHTSGLGGAMGSFGVSWTMAALVSSTAGIPMKLPVMENFGTYTSSLLQKTYTLGNILEKEGYKNVFMAGSDATFGGRKVYYQGHGNYEIKDLFTAYKDGIVEDGYYNFWGFEDSYLFNYAKKELTELAKSDQPFNFEVLTVNSHFPDGLVEKDCDTSKYSDSYTNAVRCSSKYVSAFVKWIQEQDFYENTTIIISGDHLSMANNPILGDDNYPRNVYNVIINSAIKNPDQKVTKNRLFTTMDFFPTALAAIGAKIDGDKLGLGVNLYSGQPTLAEELGLDVLNDELIKRSNFYTNKFI